MKLHGAALAIIRFIDDTSYFDFTSAGRLHTIRIGVGALNVDVDLVRLDETQPVHWIELALQHDGLAQRLGDAHEPAGTTVVQRPGGDVHVVGRVADERKQRPDLLGFDSAAAQRALRLAGGAAGVDHRRAGFGGGRDLAARRTRPRRSPRPTSIMPSRAAPSKTRTCSTFGRSSRMRSNIGANSAST